MAASPAPFPECYLLANKGGGGGGRYLQTKCKTGTRDMPLRDSA